MMQVDAVRFFTLSFPQEVIREPILHNISVKFNVAFCITHANVSESVGRLSLSFTSSDSGNIDAAIAYLRDRGVEIREQPAPVTS